MAKGAILNRVAAGGGSQPGRPGGVPRSAYPATCLYGVQPGRPGGVPRSAYPATRLSLPTAPPSVHDRVYGAPLAYNYSQEAQVGSFPGCLPGSALRSNRKLHPASLPGQPYLPHPLPFPLPLPDPLSSPPSSPCSSRSAGRWLQVIATFSIYIQLHPICLPPSVFHVFQVWPALLPRICPVDGPA